MLYRIRRKRFLGAGLVETEIVKPESISETHEKYEELLEKINQLEARLEAQKEAHKEVEVEKKEEGGQIEAKKEISLSPTEQFYKEVIEEDYEHDYDNEDVFKQDGKCCFRGDYLYMLFKNWCADNGERCISRKMFLLKLDEKYNVQKVRKNNIRYIKFI